MESTMLSMVHEIVFGVGFALVLPLFFGLDVVLYSMPVSDILTAVISAIIIVKTYEQLSTTIRILPAPIRCLLGLVRIISVGLRWQGE